MNEKALEAIKESVFRGEADATASAVEQALKTGTATPSQVMDELTKAVRELGSKFENGEAFITDLIMGSNCVKAGFDTVLKSAPSSETGVKKVGKCLICTVEGDIHSIGKDIVKTMLEANGFEVFDLGIDVPVQSIVQKTKELSPDIIGMSALLTTTMIHQRETIDGLAKAGLRKRSKVMVGGAPVNQKWSEEIGADAYGEDAVQAVKKAQQLIAAK